MTTQPILIIMAAGMGSRYGGLKQMEAVGENGEWIIDYSLYDAYQAGFRKVIFIIREEFRTDFRETIGQRIEPYFAVEYVSQSVNDVPTVSKNITGRKKPWGTGHAIYSARVAIGNAPFMVINADDYYGAGAFHALFQHLCQPNACHAMVGYELANTITPFGSVSRGVCTVNAEGYLEDIVERTKISKVGEQIVYEMQDGTLHALSPGTPVSLNCWGFMPEILAHISQGFSTFLHQLCEEQLHTQEYYLPTVVEEYMKQQHGLVRVIPNTECWYGVTYQEDKPMVISALQAMTKQGKYPSHLWGQ